MAKFKRLIMLAALALPAGAAPAVAAGKDFGGDGQIVLSVDRLFGLSFTTTRTESGDGSGQTQTDTDTAVSLLLPNGTTPYQIPRGAFDVVVVSGFTVGGAIGYGTRSGTTKLEQNGVSTERDSPSTTVFAFAPRVGYVLPLSETFAFWPRGGVTYYNIKTELTLSGLGPGATQTTSTISQNGLAMDLEAMFVFSPVSYFGITAGPLLDFPLSGSQSSEINPNPTGTAIPDDKVKYTSFGVTFGILGYF